MPTDNHPEVLVVGAGPVGLLTSLVLTRNGVRTRIIDAEHRTTAQSYACALHPSSLCLLESLGLADEAIELGHKVETITFYEGEIARTHLKLSDLPGRYPFVVVLEQAVLENLLEQQLRRTGATVEWNHRLVSIKTRQNGVDAGVEKAGSSAQKPGKPHLTIPADFMVGADGCNSTTRRLLRIHAGRAGSPRLFGVYEIETTEPVDSDIKVVLSESASAVLWPLAKNRCRWTLQLASAKVAGEFPRKERARLINDRTRAEVQGIHELHDFLARRVPWFPVQKIGEMNWVAVVQFQPQLAPRFGHGRCWLAGDSVHQTSPAGMQSMNIGLREGADLANKLKTILRDKVGLQVLQAYNRVHQAHWRQLLGLRILPRIPDSVLFWATRHLSTVVSAKEDKSSRRSFPLWARPYSRTTSAAYQLRVMT
ncbi:MAG TPA: FAD-dependent monooxygenase [Verrucomicrobiae bacterium]|nr:FAD-dependent monooxygenase [Verrucomicrobiae bacterium]